jgi:hypothetical protein
VDPAPQESLLLRQVKTKKAKRLYNLFMFKGQG